MDWVALSDFAFLFLIVVTSPGFASSIYPVSLGGMTTRRLHSR